MAIADNPTQKEAWENLHYKVLENGYEYAFMSYSYFEEIQDPEFHKLRKAVIQALANVSVYCESKFKDLGLEDK